jgi:DNA-directed RNA polymerase specialized sigma24 family protein
MIVGVGEPDRRLAGVTGVSPPRGSDDRALRDLYAATYPRLVAVVAAIGGDRHAAEEAVQGAFVS